MSESYRIVFISHSHRDREKINILYKIVKSYYANTDDYQIICTCIPEGDLDICANIADGTVGMVNKSDFFLAYISDNYQKSPICMAELGAAYARFKSKRNKSKRNKSNIFEFLPIKDKYIEHSDLNPLLKNNIIIDADDSIKMQSALNKAFDKEYENIYKDLSNAFSEHYDGYDHELNTTVTYFEKLIEETFSHQSHTLREKPIIIYIERKVYDALSMRLAILGGERLLWTTYLSPLLVDNVNLDEQKLTNYDGFFKDHKSNVKQRLIIFSTKDEQDKYFEEKEPGLVERRNAFYDANKGYLYYTTQQEIINSYNSSNKNNPNFNSIDINSELYLEFAMMRSKSAVVLFFSDFDNKTTYMNGTQDEPIVFINPDIKYKINFEQKILNSININNYISESFDKLVGIKKVIKRILL